MDLKEVDEKLNLLDMSPIRRHLKMNNGVSLFEDEKVLLSDIDNIIKVNKENLKSPLKIVVLGEVKAGKSTLVNALLGKKVSYTNVVEATAAIVEIKYASNDKIIIHEKDKEEIILNSLDELDNLIKINTCNQEFFSKIDKISIFTNTERLKEITIVDTPGLNTVTVENADRTNKYIANADVILWIMNSHHLGQSDVSQKIEEILDLGKPIIAVLNRIDEISAESYEIVDYVKSEMGYMFKEVFATSAKLAWNGYNEKDDLKVQESKIIELYEYLVNNIERNAERVQKESILESMNVQITKDVHTHKNIKVKLESILDKCDKDLKELDDFNNRIKQIVNNKIDEWIDTRFFEEEKQLMTGCGDEKEFMKLVKRYKNDEYIYNVISSEYEKLNVYLLDEWRNNTEQFMKMQDKGELSSISVVDEYLVIEQNSGSTQNNIIEGVKQGGAAAGAIGLGLAGYAAWLGPAAAYVSIGSAVSAFFPPLLIAGAMGGAAWRFVAKDKDKVNRYSQVDLIVHEIKDKLKNNAIKNMKSNLNEASDHYYNNSALMIMSILQQCNTSKEEVEKMIPKIEKYIKSIEMI